MRAWHLALVLVSCVVACRKPNPEWLGPSDAGITSTTSEDASDVGDDTSVDTLGAACANNGECPLPLRCGPNGCHWGAAGDACENNDDCREDAPICEEGLCDPSTFGMPCTATEECEPLLCGPTNTCQSGRAGEPCDRKQNCAGSLKCTDGRCGG